MTIIVANKHSMIADSGEFQGNIASRVAHPKVIRNKQGWLAGSAGGAGAAATFAKWFLNGMPDAGPKIEDDKFSVLLLSPDGKIWRAEADLVLFETPNPSVCGEETTEAFVVGAMAAGATPLGAVQLACEYCVWVRGPVQIERLQPVMEEAEE